MAVKLGVTIAVCTWNRSKSLRKTLLSLQKLAIPPAVDWEVLIVNNNCSDDTDEVVGQFANRLPIRLLHEKRQGLSRARNCAIETAKGDYILWTDDDVIVDPNWLATYTNAASIWPEAALFGGSIRLQFEGSSPAWLPEMLCAGGFASVYAHRDLSEIPIKLNFPNAMPYGANLCIRTRDQRNFRYDSSFGRCGNEQVRGEESDVVKRMLDSGAEGWWVPGAVVNHVINEDLQTQEHIRRYFVGLGRSNIRGHKGPNPPFLFHALRLLLSAMKWELRFQVSRLSGPPKIWLKDLKWASIRWGELFEFLRYSRKT